MPITVAATTGSIILLILLSTTNLLADSYPFKNIIITNLILLSGIFTFLFAMFWDKADTKRITYKSDVAFWLHLIAAPMIIHSILTLLGVFSDNNSIAMMIIIMILYLAITCLSIIIDRRALMVSALGYVIYALGNILSSFDSLIDYTFAVTGIIIGSSLLLLAIYWHKARYYLLKTMPYWVIKNIPLSH